MVSMQTPTSVHAMSGGMVPNVAGRSMAGMTMPMMRKRMGQTSQLSNFGQVDLTSGMMGYSRGGIKTRRRR